MPRVNGPNPQMQLPKELQAALREVQRTGDPMSMIDFLQRNRIKSPAEVSVEQAMSRVWRKGYLPKEVRWRAEEDVPLPIGHDQTSTAPDVIRYMLTKLYVRYGMTVLEVGTGCGYQTAILAELVGPHGRVVTIERIEEFYKKAQVSVAGDGRRNVTFVFGSGAKGHKPMAPYDRIIFSAAATKFPEEALRQLKVGGIMLVHVWRREDTRLHLGMTASQHLIMATRLSRNKFKKEDFGPMASFVPLVENDSCLRIH